MSFDLYFYRHNNNNSNVGQEEIAKYLSDNLVAPNENNNQWFFENEDTGVYYSFSIEEQDDDPESAAMFENFSDFTNTRFIFNLNFIRPDFFGLEAFGFVEKLLSALDLYVLNPQSDVDDLNPRKESFDSLYKNWSKSNHSFSRERFAEFQLLYHPTERSEKLWEYAFHRKQMQDTLGEEYFVAGSFYVGELGSGRATTLTTWTKNIPCVLPPVDYVALSRTRKKFFRELDETGIVSFETLMAHMGHLFEKHEHGGHIIRSDRAEGAAYIFNRVPFEKQLSEMGSRIDLQYLTNANST